MHDTQKETVSGFEALRLAFIEKGKLSPPFEEIPLEVLQLDWEKAKGLQVDPETFDHDEAWKLICRLGLSKASVLPLIDPAIVHIIDRLMNFPVLPIASCSGHPWAAMPWVTVIFREHGFGSRFISGLKFFAQERKINLNVNSYISRQVGGFGPRLPLGLCLQYRLPVTISIYAENVQDALNFWSVFSATMDRFDARGATEIDEAKFGFCVSTDERPEFLSKIWESLSLG
jgi:hypothetical protein